jgi:pimeloyl-[acyl-carrier protein] methyl ester esterase
MEEDHRAAIPGFNVPTLIIHGERDQLVPVGAARFMATQMKQARLEIIPSAGHAPFLTHADLFVEKLKDFIHG